MVKKSLLFLLATMLFMSGCSSENEPQSVAFSIKEIKVNEDASKLNIIIDANCPWIISDEKNKTYTNPQSGNGITEATIAVFCNPDYDDKVYTISVTSEDGTSSDILTIRQDATKGLEVENIEMISEEGGVFTIPVNTNDEITKVSTPDWVTFTSSRFLTGYTYSFIAEPNKTGSVRNGSVTISSKKLSKSIFVEQDSYAPTEVKLQQDFSFIPGRKFSSAISIIPEYSDPSKIEMTTSKDCSARIENGYLIIDTQEYGKHELSISSKNGELFYKLFESLPEMPFYSEPMESYRGQTDINIGWTYYSPLYELKSTDESVICVVDNKKFEAVGFGSAIVSAGIPGTNIYSERNVTVEPFMLKARIGWFGEQFDGSFNVTFTALVEGPTNMTCSGFLVVNRDGYVVIFNNGSIKDFGVFGKSINSSVINIKYDRSKYQNIMDALYGYMFMVKVVIDGKVYQRTVKIDNHVVGSF